MIGRSLIGRYAFELFNYAKEENQLEAFYTQALILTQGNDRPNIYNVSDKLDSFLKVVPEEIKNSVLSKFINISQKHLGLLYVEVFSAVPLTDKQRIDIENKLVKLLDKKINMDVKLDPSLLGGLRIVAGHTVIDNSIKKNISDLKKSMYSVSKV